MKILHVVGGDLKEGAARGAYWLHRGLKKNGLTTNILTNSFDTLGDSDVLTIADSPLKRLISVVRANLDNLLVRCYPKRKRVIFSSGLFGADITRTPLYQKADIIHLHWINGGLIDIKLLGRIDKPIVWTMRDMWPMTGGCHVAEFFGCSGYRYGCGKCIQLASSHSFDFSRLIFKRKQKYLPPDIKYVGISHWLTECAGKSSLLQNCDIRTIPNNIDCEEFRPVTKQVAREILGLPPNHKIVLAGTRDSAVLYKGFGKFIESLGKVDKKNVHLLFFGKVDTEFVLNTGFSYTSLGLLSDTYSLRLAYSAADVFVSPSLIESFGKTIAEAMACCTPVVCFDATGPRDIVDHKQNGYLARPYEPEDLAAGINWVLRHEKEYKVLGEHAREKIMNDFDISVIAKKYEQLYEEILD